MKNSDREKKKADGKETPGERKPCTDSTPQSRCGAIYMYLTFVLHYTEAICEMYLPRQRDSSHRIAL